MKYQTRHQPVDAVQFQGGNHVQVYDFADVPAQHRQAESGVPLILWRREPEGTVPLSPGDWVVKEAYGKITALQDSDFHRFYEERTIKGMCTGIKLL